MLKKEPIDFYSKTNLKSYNLDSAMRYQLNMLDTLDVFTRKHCENVANLTCRLCEYLKCSTDFTVYCTICAYLHDIGKTFIPASILQKNSSLTNEEYEIMKKHTTIGYEMCMKDVKLRKYCAGAKFHHEALNGTGYPEGLEKKDIPIEGQIIRVADEFDAIVSKRQYKSHIDISDTLEILIKDATPEKDNPKAKSKRYGKINSQVLKALFKVVIDDIEYEISSTDEYLKYLEENIKRLKIIKDYDEKAQNAKTDKKKEYYQEGMKFLFEKDENFSNYISILEQYENALRVRQEHIQKLFDEMKKIKKMKI